MQVLFLKLINLKSRHLAAVGSKFAISFGAESGLVLHPQWK